MTSPERTAPRSRSWMIVLRGARALRFDRWVVRWTGISLVTLQYSLAGRQRYTPTLLLTTIGASSGRLWTVALPYVCVDDDLVVIGSRGGGPVDPKWAGNVRAAPQCWIRVRRHLAPATAHVASGDERARLYERITAVMPSTARYQQQAARFGREIPLVVIRPRAPLPPARWPRRTLRA